MRTTYFALCVVLAGLPGCSLVLDLDSLRGGDAGARDASTDASADGAAHDVGPVDAARDAHLADANLPDANLPDTGLDADLPDAVVLFDAGSDAGADAGNDAGTDAGSDAGTDGGTDAGSDAGHDGGSDGGSDAGRDAAMPTVGVTGTVVGLPVGSSIIVANGAVTQNVDGTSGTTSFTFRVAPGASYDVSITSAPSTLLCVLYRGQGVASADVTNLFVGCSTAVGLVSYFPFDGDYHAVRGTDWSSTAGTITYTADRIGRANRAVPALAGLDYRIVRPLDGSSSVPSGGTQFTASMWMLLPGSVSTTTNENMFSHVGSASQSVSMQVTWVGTNPYLRLYFYWDGGGTMYPTSPTVLDRDHWHHMVVAASGPSGSVTNGFVRGLFIDGVRVASAATCCGWGNTTQFWLFSGSNVLRDDLRLYGRMLSDTEIAGIYAAENVP